MADELAGKIAEIFKELHAASAGASAAELTREVDDSMAEFEEAAAQNGLLPLDIAQDLADAIGSLLEIYKDFSPEQQQLIAGAVRYFVSEDDAVPDTEGVLGLDDDVEVFNYVVEKLGQPQRKLDL